MLVIPQKVLEIQHYTREPISLDQSSCDEGDNRLGDFIQDSQAVNALDAAAFGLLQAQLQTVLATLNEREAGVVRLRFGLTDDRPRTLDEIDRVYGVTCERIRQIEPDRWPNCATPLAPRNCATTSTSPPGLLGSHRRRPLPPEPGSGPR